MDDTFKLRRWCAITSFVVVVALIPTLLIMSVTVDPKQAPMMQVIMPILVIIIPALITVIMKYMYSVLKSDLAGQNE